MTFSQLAYDSTYEEFLEVEARIRYIEDLREAQERDHKREEERKQQLNSL